MNERMVSTILRADAVFSFAVGILLLAGTWDGLYDTLDLPQARPAVFVQVGGALLIAFAYLLWKAPAEATMTREVALGAAVANGLAAIIIVLWLTAAETGIDTLGTVLLAVAAAVLAGFAVAEAAIARQPVVIRQSLPTR